MKAEESCQCVLMRPYSRSAGCLERRLRHPRGVEEARGEGPGAVKQDGDFARVRA